jgi:hypothetical protein
MNVHGAESLAQLSGLIHDTYPARRKKRQEVPAMAHTHITAKKRHSLPSSDFVFPKTEGYPVDTKKRAKAALSYGARNLSGPDLAKVRRKVHSRFPGIEVSGIASRLSGRTRRN